MTVRGSSRRALRVQVKPNARASSLELRDDGTWIARLRSPPVDGRANEELVALVAKRFGCARSAVRVKAGAGSRLKLLEIAAE